MDTANESTLSWSDSYDDGSTGVESEDVSSGAIIREPFDPTLIRVAPKMMTIDLLLKRVTQGALDLSPGFQRRGGIWTTEAQSKLIESILIRIPIPAIYVDATDEERWLIVDGLQRLTALRRFVVTGDLRLRGLEFLADLEGKSFEELTLRFKRRILETQFFVYAIEEGTPPNVKFNIFKRINTGGLPLSAQEIRHALNQGKATEFLNRLATSGAFLAATTKSISDKRMADEECVLRFVAFILTPYTSYKTADLDGFLNSTMASMNSLSDASLDELADSFSSAMAAAHDIFGGDAFRKRYSADHGRYPISKTLFETWSVNLARLSRQETAVLEKRKDVLLGKFMALMATRDFNDAVSQGTGDVGKVKARFGEIERIIQEVIR
jgi:hypothetical protein